MDGRGHHHNAGRALRDERRDGVRGIERVAWVHAFEETTRLLDEADLLVADHVRKRAGADRREGEYLKAMRQQSAQAMRLAERDVVVDRVIVAGQHLEGGKMRFGDRPARAA